ncbi:transcriptional regulator [Pilimelia terevasa]|uniref:Transcriptional regulator n=1 Tax=Pilimelia terevasa TaxID=53372 RepID=A0A8J3FK19_9ACTN|nr:LuxR C-terminal-related transcriptional regulator [Pilimelia terevasa]GGK41916.1 transcriptional regulator [Pilimelia terevasa]
MIGLSPASVIPADLPRAVAGGGAADSATPNLPAIKITVPPLPPTYGTRRRLATRFAAVARRRVTTVLGPPGAGKTSAVAHWVRSGQAPGPVAWLTLDEEDNTPQRFWPHVLAALAGHAPGAARALPPTGRVDGAIAGRVATALGHRATPVVLVLDRVELITDPALTHELDLLVAYARSGLRLVLCGRGGNVGWLHRHRLAGDVAEISPADLALDADEVPEILRAHGVPDLPDADIRALHACTEGWMTGVCLHALALRSGVGPAVLPHPLGRQAVTDFLRTEVLDAQPARVRHLLLRTSLLDRVDPGLADQLTGRSDARAILSRLARANSFVAHADGAQFRYREPLRTMLLDALVGSRPDLVARLHTTAARWYAQRGSPATAVAHAVRGGDWEFATAVAVDRVGVAALLAAPGARPVRERLAALPDAARDTAAELVRCVLALAGHDVPRAGAALERAGRAAGATPRRRAAVEVARVAVARLTGDGDAAAAAAERYAQASPEVRVDAARTRRFLDANLGVALLWAGRLDAARAALTGAAAAPVAGVEFSAHDALGHLGLLSMYEGRTTEADALAGQAIALAERAGVPPAERVGAASATLAATALVRNDLPAARQHAADSLATLTARTDPPTAMTLALIRAWVACARRDGAAAIAATGAARAHLRRTRPPRLISDRIELTALWAHLIVGDLAAARGCVDRIGDRAERTVAEGYLLEARGEVEAARATLARVAGPDASPSALQYAALALGRLAAATGDVPTATRALGDALDYGRPDRRRRAVADSGTWAPPLLRGNATIARDHPWLTARAADGAPPVAGGLPQPLTDREAQVLRHLSEAVAIRDIAGTMGLSVNTVKTHLKNIYRKLGATGRSAAARRARELNLIAGECGPRS